MQLVRFGSKAFITGRPAVLLLIGGMLSGCGPSGPVTAPVRGIVTFEGKPVTTGKVMFYPSEGRASNGPIASDGTYELRGGALIGSHLVTIKATEVTNAPPEPKSFEEEIKGIGVGPLKGGGPRIVWLVPQPYSNRGTSALTAEVVAGQENVIDFEITGEPGKNNIGSSKKAEQ